MAYTAPQIGTILLKADRTMYKIGQIAYENMFAEDNEALDYERDIIFIYKKAVEYADDLFLGTEKLDKVVERLAAKISAYDYGELNPIYADAALLNIPILLPGSELNDLTDVTITNLLDNQLLRYNAATGQWINVGPGSAVRNSQAFIATAGQTVFTTSFPFDAGLFDLYLNGVKLNSMSYTTMGEYQITLNDACSLGDIVDVVIYDPNSSITPTSNTLNDLTDVAIGPLSNKQALYYNSATGLWENGLVFVPYTGAVSSVNLGSYGITSSFYQANTAAIEADAVGKLIWDDTECTFKFMMKGGNVIQRIGQDLPVPVKHADNTGLSKGSVVYTVGSDGANKTVRYAIATGDSTSSKTFGVIAETVSGGAKALCTTYGYVRNVNTIGLTEGAAIWLSPTVSGGMTSTKPSAPNHLVYIGVCIKSHATEGIVFVNIQNGYELEELHNVDALNPNNNDGLFYNSTTSLWEHKQISTALGYTPANAATTLTINGVSYDLSTSRTWSVGTITGSGASGQVAYWTGASSQSGSNNLFWDNANGRLGINGSTSPLRPLEVFNSGNWISATFSGSGGTPKVVVGNLSGNPVIGGHNDALTGWAALAINPDGGNVLIGTSSNGSQKLQVIGDTLLRGSGNTSATTALTVQNSSSTNLFTVRNNGVMAQGGGADASINLYMQKGLSGSVYPGGIYMNGIISSTSTSGATYFTSDANTQAASFTLPRLEHFKVRQGVIGAGSTINNQYGFFVESTLNGATNNYGFWGDIAAGTGRWNLYMNGTANNYLSGRLGIGSTSLTDINLRVSGNLSGSVGPLAVYADGLITSTSTTAAGYFFTTARTEAETFTLPSLAHYTANQQTFGAGSTVTTQVGFRVNSTLTGATTNYAFQGSLAASGTSRWNLFMDGTAANYMNGELLLGSLTNSGEKLQVTGTMKVTGASSYGGNMTLSLNQNNITSFAISNTTIGTSAQSRIILSAGSSGDGFIGKVTSSYLAYKITNPNDFYLYNWTAGDISILNDFASGKITFSAGGSSTAHMTIKSNGRINMSSLPTSSTGLATGDLWNNAGVINIV